ncbi:MAG: DNA topoisomerase (ATP-hydrolyzing) subunit A [Spirochaetaceae bacterium]
MADNRGQVIPINIEDEVKESFLNYAMSVIVSRALPDVRDGLKPVHRRVLYAMDEMGLRVDRPTKKCARIVGDVLGKYHPHGDASVYDALVRMGQSFSMRYPIIRPQGNFGSVDGDPPAAMRYTEAKLDRIAEEMTADIKKETVDFTANYDDSMREPTVLPAAFPYLLANGAYGIAVGMATNMPPHNIREICDAICAVIDEPDVSIDELMRYVTAPDFPTGGIIYGRRGIKEAYRTGKGRVPVRARFSIESTKSGKDVIIVHEIPYLVNKANLVMKIADLVNDRKIEGIADLRDESDRNGMRIVIELKRGVSPKIVLNHLFQNTQLQVNFAVNNVALVDGRPKVLNLKELIECFIRHRKEVVTRRTRYDLRKAEEREHILVGLKIALDNIDEVIRIIRQSADTETARNGLMNAFELSEIQAQAILDMRLQKLTSLETRKIIEELEEVRRLIAYYKELLASEEKLLGVVRDETVAISEKYGDDRRTEVVPDEIEAIDIEDLIQKEPMVVVMSHQGYVKRVPLSAYRLQGRGGKGSMSSRLREEDFVQHLFIASTHAYILFVSSEGKAYWMKVHEIPEAGRTARGFHIKGLLNITANEEIAAVVSLKDFSDDSYVFMATSRGVVKKVRTSDFSNARVRGIVAVRLDDGDKLVHAMLTTGTSDILLVTKSGLALRFDEAQVRAMGRATRGVQGIKLQERDELAGAVCVNQEHDLVVLSEFGHGKRVRFDEFTPHGRGTRGQKVFTPAERTGEIVGVLSGTDEDDIMVITSQGSTVKLNLSTIPVYGRAATGVRIVHIERPDFVVGVDRAANEDEEDPDQPEGSSEHSEPFDPVEPPEPDSPESDQTET